MPEMMFRVRWPDGELATCFSPSTIVAQRLIAMHDYPVSEFTQVARAALEEANVRVRARFGMGCAHAIAQIEQIELRAAEFASDPDATVRVEGFDQ
ncbi:MSMEG_0570 family nitrogen starvation response protein [Novosphingobium sp. PP1Y]|uniref:MSMEG_0570 family nitrogen starvation response protein n=1 Tax=Novosphingobium sp. PP1Y TaxID=702113 RepID=UPI00030C5B57|nr:MSMEG_0570 family nitrogen starvation response protein [Novosphingobium sp. PP1Y]